MLISRHRHRVRLRGHCRRNLRGDQEGRKDGRHTDESQELINRKHRPSPRKRAIQMARLVRPLRGPLLAGQTLVGVGRSGNCQQRKN